MKITSSVILIELIFFFALLTSSFLNNNGLDNKHSNVLSANIAQADSSTDTPTDQASPQDTSTATPEDTSSPVDTATTSSTSEPSTPEASGTATSEPNSALPALQSAQETISQNISQQILTDYQDEDQQISQTQLPADKEQILVHFADDKINDIENSTRTKDFTTTLLATERLSNQIDQITDITNNQLTFDKQTSAKQDLKDLCSAVNGTLRTAQEIVQEETETDMEIVRGKCLVQFAY